MSFADQLTLARAAAVPIVIVLFVWDFPNHNYWATAVFAVAMATDWFDGRLARRSGRTSALGSLLDPVADKLLVLTVMILLVGEGVWPGWMVALIVARELLVSGLRLALALTWISGLDYARLAPRLLRGDPTAGSARGTKSSESTFSSSPASRQTLP
jgi:CDP-diacylglycerol--glycerol-3-phosphate 3-phosphatidyltransferase